MTYIPATTSTPSKTLNELRLNDPVTYHKLVAHNVGLPPTISTIKGSVELYIDIVTGFRPGLAMDKALDTLFLSIKSKLSTKEPT